MALRKIYNILPKIIKTPVDIIYGSIPNSTKYGKEFSQTKAMLSESQWWTHDKHIEYQVNQLKKLLIHSYEHVPYYKKTFDSCGFDPYNFGNLEQMQKIPLLNKNIIQENFNDLIADNFSLKDTALNTTGGTSGNQMKFYSERNYNQIEWPFVELIWSRVGYTQKSRVAVLRNHLFKNEEIFYFDRATRRLILDNFHLSDANIELILDKLCLDKIEYIHTYPSAILTICDYIRRSGYKMSYTPKAILATSENIYPGQKEIIQNILKCRVFTFYGHSERACIAGWCENSDLYHIQSEYGHMELIDQNDKVIQDPDTLGEIVCTGFYNRAMPFIRYQTGDFSSYANEQVCDCGRNYKLLNNIEGRWMQEMLFCKDNSKISVAALNMHSDVFKNVKYFQLYQDTKGECLINIVKTDKYTTEDEINILNEFLKKTGSSINFKIKYVENIEKTQRGKYKYLIQRILV